MRGVDFQLLNNVLEIDHDGRSWSLGSRDSIFSSSTRMRIFYVTASMNEQWICAEEERLTLSLTWPGLLHPLFEDFKVTVLASRGMLCNKMKEVLGSCDCCLKVFTFARAQSSWIICFVPVFLLRTRLRNLFPISNARRASSDASRSRRLRVGLRGVPTELRRALQSP